MKKDFLLKKLLLLLLLCICSFWAANARTVKLIPKMTITKTYDGTSSLPANIESFFDIYEAADDAIFVQKSSLSAVHGSLTGSYSSSNAGNFSISLTLTSTISGETNFYVAYPAGLSGEITPRELTLTDFDVASVACTKIYDGNASVDPTKINWGTTLNNVVSGEESKVALDKDNAKVTFPSKDVATGNLSIYLPTKNPNYIIVPPVIPCSITPKALVIKPNVLSKTYGDPDPSTFTYIQTGLVSPDQITGTLSRVPGENVGKYEIQKHDLSAGNNYTMTVEKVDFEIKPYIITITANTTSKPYGQNDPAFSFSQDKPLLNGDNFHDLLKRTPGEAVGSYPFVLSAGSNYQIDFTTKDFQITAPGIVLDSNNNLFDLSGAPIFTGSLKACEGTSNNGLEVNVTGHDLHYKWHKDDVPITNVDNKKLIFAGTTSESGVYYVEVSDTHSSTPVRSNFVTVSISPTTVISTQPTGDLICASQNHLFTADVKGSNLQYNWQRQTGNTWMTVSTAKDYVTDIEGVYHVTVNGDCGSKTSNNVALNVGISGNDIYNSLWSDVLSIECNPAKNGGYTFTEFQWYKRGTAGNDSPMLDATKPYYQIKTTDEYYCKMKLADGTYKYTCPRAGVVPTAVLRSAYPNPVRSGGVINIHANNSYQVENGTVKVIVFSVDGKCIDTKTLVAGEQSITMPTVAGTYILRIINQDGSVETAKVVVE